LFSVTPLVVRKIVEQLQPAELLLRRGCEQIDGGLFSKRLCVLLQHSLVFGREVRQHRWVK
jgi:hypothetical protein